MTVARSDLERVRDWAAQKIADGGEPPSAWYQYMKLREALDALIDGVALSFTPADSPELAAHPGTVVRLPVGSARQDIARSRP